MNKILILCFFTVIILLYFLFSHQLVEKYIKFGDTNIDTTTYQSKSANINYRMGKITLPSNLKCNNLTKEQKPLIDNNCIMQQKGFKFKIQNKNPFIPIPGIRSIERLAFNIDINNVDYYDYDKINTVKEWFQKYPLGKISVNSMSNKTIQIPFYGIVNLKSKTALLPEYSFQILSL